MKYRYGLIYYLTDKTVREQTCLVPDCGSVLRWWHSDLPNININIRWNHSHGAVVYLKYKQTLHQDRVHQDRVINNTHAAEHPSALVTLVVTCSLCKDFVLVRPAVWLLRIDFSLVWTNCGESGMILYIFKQASLWSRRCSCLFCRPCPTRTDQSMAAITKATWITLIRARRQETSVFFRTGHVS